jgi:flagellar biosynthesis component FlhA
LAHHQPKVRTLLAAGSIYELGMEIAPARVIFREGHEGVGNTIVALELIPVTVMAAGVAHLPRLRLSGFA